MSIKYVENQTDFENIIDQNQYVLVEFFCHLVSALPGF